MEKSSLDYREKLYSQIQEEYGKLVYTYTCHFKMADRLSKRNFWIKWGQIGLSAISTGGFLGVLISNEQILLWAGGLCSTALLIDSFVYQAIGNWRWLSSGESSTSAAGTYEKILLDYYNQHFMWGAMPLSAPGSNQQVSTDNSRDCLGKVLRYIAG